MADSGGRAAPPVAAAAREALERQATVVRDWANGEIRRVEGRRDEELRRLERAIVCLGGETREGPSKPRRAPDRRPKPRRRRASRAGTTPAAVGERREAVLRYLREQSRPLSRGEICRALRLTPHTVNTALNLLVKEGKAERVGSGAATRYKLASSGGRAHATGEATLQGRIVETLHERGWASLEELVQAIGVPREEVLRECGRLVKEEEIEMDRREGRAVYVCRGDS
jgi:Fe2+ or Zn2+ uptake regulation protein